MTSFVQRSPLIFYGTDNKPFLTETEVTDKSEPWIRNYLEVTKVAYHFFSETYHFCGVNGKGKVLNAYFVQTKEDSNDKSIAENKKFEMSSKVNELEFVKTWTEAIFGAKFHSSETLDGKALCVAARNIYPLAFSLLKQDEKISMGDEKITIIKAWNFLEKPKRWDFHDESERSILSKSRTVSGVFISIIEKLHKEVTTLDIIQNITHPDCSHVEIISKIWFQAMMSITVNETIENFAVKTLDQVKKLSYDKEKFTKAISSAWTDIHVKLPEPKKESSTANSSMVTHYVSADPSRPAWDQRTISVVYGHPDETKNSNENRTFNRQSSATYGLNGGTYRQNELNSASNTRSFDSIRLLQAFLRQNSYRNRQNIAKKRKYSKITG